MAFQSTVSQSEENPEIISEINITPLTDIFLVLLIIFMVTAPALIQQGPKVDLPGSASKGEALTGLTITLTQDRKIFLNGEEVPRAGLVAAIQKELPKTTKQEVVLNADKGLVLEEIVKVMDLARKGAPKNLPLPHVQLVLKQTKIQGLNIVYREEGEGTPLFLLHGLGASRPIWDKNVDALAKSFRVIAPDLPGCGQSDKPLSFDYSLLNLTQFMREFVSSFNAKEVFVAGNSLGGGIALLSANDLAPILKGLILISPICYPQNIPDGFKVAKMPVVGELSLITLGKWTVRFVLKESVYDDKLVTEEWVQKLANPVYSFKWRYAQMKTIRGIIPEDVSAVVESYKKVKVPTQIIWGEKDFITPTSMASRLHQDIQGSQLNILAKSAHIPHWEKPEEVNQLILSFLSNLN